MDFLFESDTDDEVSWCDMFCGVPWLEVNESTKVLFCSPNHPQGQNGFEELRRYVKQGGDFGKDLAAILQER